MREFKIAVLSSLVSAITIAIFLGAWNDYLLKRSNITGSWEMQLTYVNTAYEPYKGMTIVYDLVLSQDNNRIIGHGEKSRDDRGEIARENKAILEMNGGITYKIFSKDTINIFYQETNPEGRNGSLKSSTVLILTQEDNDTIKGKFRSTIANTEGEVTLSRKKPGTE